MQLLFVLSASASRHELLGMAQLSAAFGQTVRIWHPKGTLDHTMIDDCQQAGITALSSTTDDLKHWLDSCDRVVRL